MPLDRMKELFARIVQTLDAARERSIAHRDIKPANIYVGHIDRDRRFQTCPAMWHAFERSLPTTGRA